MTPPDPPEGPIGFERDVFIDKPGIVGASWWHKSLIVEDAAVRRRHVLKTIGVIAAVGGAVALAGIGIAKLAQGDKVHLESRQSLALQIAYGWDVGARGEALVFDGSGTAPFNRATLHDLPSVMQPISFAPLAITTVLESLDASPKDSLPAGDTTTFQRLSDVVQPRETDAMRRAYAAGEAFARLAHDYPNDLAVLADMKGALSVAFAAGACRVFEPVLLFDNWPHPRGVVPSHAVLSALAYYQPLFANAKLARPAASARPLFLLDNLRLSPYSEDAKRFDNRYYARFPSFDALKAKGFRKLFYVVETPESLPESNDLSLGDSRGLIDARVFAISEFGAPGTDTTTYYGGAPETDASFWINYPFVADYKLLPDTRIFASKTMDYRFKSHDNSTKLATIGVTAVAVAASGVLLAAALDRSGSMNRFAGGWNG